VPCPRLSWAWCEFSGDSHAHDKRGHGTVSFRNKNKVARGRKSGFDPGEPPKILFTQAMRNHFGISTNSNAILAIFFTNSGRGNRRFSILARNLGNLFLFYRFRHLFRHSFPIGSKGASFSNISLRSLSKIVSTCFRTIKCPKSSDLH
jgi:hypothetical protein